MFKRALEQGEDNSSSLERNAFVQTCKEYGLALLVDTRVLDLADAEKALAENPETPGSLGSRQKTSSRKQKRVWGKKKLLKYAVDYLSKYDTSKKNLYDILKRKIFKININSIEKK